MTKPTATLFTSSRNGWTAPSAPVPIWNTVPTGNTGSFPVSHLTCHVPMNPLTLSLMTASFRPESGMTEPKVAPPASISPPWSLKHEAGPERRVAPAPLAADRKLGRAQGRGRGEMVVPQGAIEADHELRGGAVLHPPEAGHHARRAGVEKAAGEADQPFAAHLPAERRAAAAEHDEVGVQPQAVDVAQVKEALLRPARRVDGRQGQAGEGRTLGVDRTMGGKVEDAEAAQVVTQDLRAAGGD